MLRSCLVNSKGIKATICKIINFSVVISIYHIIVHNSVVPKTVAEKLSFSELKIEKVKLFSQSSTKNFVLAFLTLEVASQVA